MHIYINPLLISVSPLPAVSTLLALVFFLLWLKRKGAIKEQCKTTDKAGVQKDKNKIDELLQQGYQIWNIDEPSILLRKEQQEHRTIIELVGVFLGGKIPIGNLLIMHQDGKHILKVFSASLVNVSKELLLVLICLRNDLGSITIEEGIRNPVLTEFVKLAGNDCLSNSSGPNFLTESQLIDFIDKIDLSADPKTLPLAT